MSRKDTNQPAFPTPVSSIASFTEGMSLRDYFAAKAMQGMLAGPDFCDMFPIYGHVAEAAYKFADAMLAARSAS